MEKKSSAIWGVISFCAGSGLQVSGWTNIYVASTLWTIAGALILYSAYSYFRSKGSLRLSIDGFNKLNELVHQAQDLLEEGAHPHVVLRDWQTRVIQWDRSVEEEMRRELPPNEAIMYANVNLRPSLNQQRDVTLGLLAGRRNKLRRVVMRLIPESLTTRVNAARS